MLPTLTSAISCSFFLLTKWTDEDERHRPPARLHMARVCRMRVSECAMAEWYEIYHKYNKKSIKKMLLFLLFRGVRHTIMMKIRFFFFLSTNETIEANEEQKNERNFRIFFFFEIPRDVASFFFPTSKSVISFSVSILSLGSLAFFHPTSDGSNTIC